MAGTVNAPRRGHRRIPKPPGSKRFLPTAVRVSPTGFSTGLSNQPDRAQGPSRGGFSARGTTQNDLLDQAASDLSTGGLARRAKLSTSERVGTATGRFTAPAKGLVRIAAVDSPCAVGWTWFGGIDRRTGSTDVGRGFAGPISTTAQGRNRPRSFPSGERVHSSLIGRNLVGAAGFEPATLCSQNRCATRLRYAPNRRPSRPLRAGVQASVCRFRDQSQGSAAGTSLEPIAGWRSVSPSAMPRRAAMPPLISSTY